MAGFQVKRITRFLKTNPIFIGDEVNKVNQVLTNYIIQQIETNNVLPWQTPWSKDSALPQNLVSGKAYRGVNALLSSFGKSPYWMTRKQIVGAGGSFKGAKSAPCVYFQIKESKQESKTEGERSRYAMMKYYRVFNVADCEGIELPKSDIEFKENNSIQRCEDLIAGYPNPPKITNDKPSNSAFYAPHADEIVTPMIGQFDDSEKYYSTLFHEMGHSTGHPSRLNRELRNTFKSHKYSKEELVAELTAAFLCREVGIDSETDQSISYIKNWLSVLKDNPEWIVWAAQNAQKAFDHIKSTED